MVKLTSDMVIHDSWALIEPSAFMSSIEFFEPSGIFGIKITQLVIYK